MILCVYVSKYVMMQSGVTGSSGAINLSTGRSNAGKSGELLLTTGQTKGASSGMEFGFFFFLTFLQNHKYCNNLPLQSIGSIQVLGGSSSIYSNRSPLIGANVTIQGGDTLSSKGMGGSIFLIGGAGKSDDMAGEIFLIF